MKWFFKISLILATLWTGYGCKKCFNKKGNLQIITHKLEYFNALDIEGKFNIYLEQSSNKSITLNGLSGVLDLVDINITDKKLIIRNNNKCSNLKNYNDWVDLTLKIDSINFARFSVPGSLKSNTLLKWNSCSLVVDQCDLQTQLNININNFDLSLKGGTSTILLNGQSNTTIINNNGDGHVYAKNLLAQKLHVYSNGTGIIEGNVSSFLETNIAGSTSFFYSGDPIHSNIKLDDSQGAFVKKR